MCHLAAVMLLVPRTATRISVGWNSAMYRFFREILFQQSCSLDPAVARGIGRLFANNKLHEPAGLPSIGSSRPTHAIRDLIFRCQTALDSRPCLRAYAGGRRALQGHIIAVNLGSSSVSSSSLVHVLAAESILQAASIIFFLSNFDLLAPGDGDLVGVSGGRIWRGPGGPEVDTNRPIGQRLEWRFYDRLRARNPLLNADPKFCALVSKIFFIKFKKHCKRCELHPSITEDVGARRRRPSTPHRTSLRAKSNLLQAAADVVARLKSVFLWCRIIFRKSSRNIFKC